MAAIFGLIFFMVLWLAGYTSLISIVEPVYVALRDKFGFTRRMTVTGVAIISILIGLLLVFDVDMIDPVDFIVGSTNLVWLVLVEAIIAGYFLGVDKLREYANPSAELKLGKWYDILIMVVAPITLVIILFYGLHSVEQIHPVSMIVMVALILASIILAGMKWLKEEEVE